MSVLRNHALNGGSDMHLAEVSRDSADDRQFRVLMAPEGAGQIDLPLGFAPVERAGDRYDIIMIRGERHASRMFELLATSGGMIVPVVVFGADAPWADYNAPTATSTHVSDAMAVAGDIADRVASLPARTRGTSDPALALLARMHTRRKSMEATYRPDIRASVYYPIAGPIHQAHELALGMAETGLLNKRFFDRLHVCPDCQSTRLNVREECPSCRSANLEEVGIVHHFKCAHEAPEMAFRKSGGLVCPKCGERLRHLGLDYDRPGSVMLCKSCGKSDDSSRIGFVCMDCGDHTDGESIASRDVYSFDLTFQGIMAVESANVDLGSGNSEGMALLRTAVERAILERDHFGGVFTVMRLDLGVPKKDRRSDERMWRETYRLAHEVAKGRLRGVDVITPNGEGFMIFLPRTDPQEATRMAADIASEFKSVLAMEVKPEFTKLDEDSIIRLAEGN